MKKKTFVFAISLLINCFSVMNIYAAYAVPDAMYAVDEVDTIKFLSAVKSGDSGKVVCTLGAIQPIESRADFVKNTVYLTGKFLGYNAFHRAVWKGKTCMLRLLLQLIPAGSKRDELLGQTFSDNSTLLDVAKRWYEHLVPILEGGFSFARR